MNWSWRFMRASELRRGGVVVALGAAFLVTMFIALQSLSLSPTQVADRDLGRFGAYAGFGSMAIAPGEDVTAALRRDLEAAGIGELAVAMISVDLQVVGPRGSEVRFVEMPFAERPFPRYHLSSGQWPQQPGEIVVASPQAGLAVGDSLGVLGGMARFRVVGLAKDDYEHQQTLLAAPGTWHLLKPEWATRFRTLQAQPVVYWSGERVDVVTDALAARAADHEDIGLDEAKERVAGSLRTREQVLADRAESWLLRSPAGYSVPSLILPVLSVLVMAGLYDRRARRNLSILMSIGAGRGRALRCVGIAIAGSALVASVVGVVVGLGLGLASGAVLAHVRDLAAGPALGLAQVLVRLVVMTAIGVLIAGALLWSSLPSSSSGSAARSRSQSTRRAVAGRQRRMKPTARDVRQLAALAAACAGVVGVTRLHSPAGAMTLAGVVAVVMLLLLPDLVPALVGLLPTGRSLSRLGQRQLLADPRRVVAGVGALVVTFGLSFGFLALLTTMVRTVDVQYAPAVLPGQVLVSDRGSFAASAPAAVVDTLARSPGVAGKPAFDLRLLLTPETATRPERRVGVEGSDRTLLAVDTVADAQRLLGDAWPVGGEVVLQQRGVLLWATADGGTSTESVTLVTTPDASGQDGTQTLEAARVRLPAVGWRDGTDGVLLTPTATRLGLPMTSGPRMFVDVGPTDAAVARAAVEEMGLDPTTVQIFADPPPVVPPTALYVTAIGLAVLLLFVSVAAARGHVQALRGYVSTLAAIGMSPGWIRGVLWYEQAVIVLIGIALGLFVSAVPVVAATTRIPGFVLGVPWRECLILGLAAIAGCAGATLLSARRLTEP